MAFSQSVKKSQIPISCHLCDTEKNKWKCIDCELLMCDKCKDGRHLRIKNAQDHRVISIKDIGLHSQELDFTNIKCPDHASQSCCLFCKICDSLVCPTCVSKVHKKHANDLIEISEAYHMKKDRLKNGQSKIQMEEKKAVAMKEQLIKRKDAEKAKHSKVIQDILNHGKVLKSDIDKYIEELKDEVDENLKTIFKSIDTDLSIVAKSMKYSNEKNNEVEDLIKSTDLANFFSDVRKMEKSMEVPVLKTQPSYNSIPKFVPGEITQSNVGVLQIEDSSEELSVSFDIIQEYQTELTIITDIIPCVDNSVWINSNVDACVIKAVPTGKELNVVSTFNMKVYGMANTKSNNLLLSVERKPRLQQLNITTGNITDSVYNMSPLLPTCIHINSDNKVIVGGYNDELGRSAVFVMRPKGEHETVYEHDRHNQPIFTFPMSITSTSNGNIHVVDRCPGKEGRVVVLTTGSDVINSYKGHPDINKDKTFKPINIVTTPRDNVMVTDLDTQSIHILDSKGNLVSWFDTEDIGILFPYCLAFTPTGQLYIGCGKSANSTAKEAKIYEVTCSGC
ncbi:tripartite motif-containing protein 71 [Mytilus galloprovincialis]|uniref:Tripartite motif-containing protein 71 n=1 Tax=Mytilus galloprovincialis TaxID=29158 RepID=A0A8B6C0P1_MYTGA|nr:tripartite motif-containing protein 71 [Mytilus galloprovincialis]